MSPTKIETWCDDGDEFEEILENAEDEARTGWGEDFVADMRSKWEQFGLSAYMTETQFSKLCKIARV